MRKEETNMAKVLGIDLGTTYSCMAYINEVGEPEVIPSAENSNVTPSVVYFESPTNVVVGEAAVSELVMEPERTVAAVKRLMGRSDLAISCFEKDYSPAQVSSLILKKMVQDAEAKLGEKITDVVITCPAYFGTAEKEATELAGRIAGLNVLKLINEPTAAAIAYGVLKGEAHKTIMVYDLGGGTFDVTIIQVNEKNGGNHIDVLATGGDHSLGGKDWDAAFMNYLFEEFCKQNNFDGYFEDEDEELVFRQMLMQEAEKQKKLLSSKMEVRIPLSSGSMRAKVVVTREKFEEVTKYLLERTITETDKLLEETRKKGINKIDEIIMVGGSSNMPQVGNILEERYPNIPKRIFQPHEAVAKGAALSQEAEIVVQDVTSKSYGIELCRETKEEKDHSYIENLITKNTKVPTKTEHRFESRYRTSAVAIKIYETNIGEKEFEIGDWEPLGTAKLTFGKTLPAQSPISVELRLGRDGILHVKGIDETTHHIIEADMQGTGLLNEEEKLEQISSMEAITVE